MQMTNKSHFEITSYDGGKRSSPQQTWNKNMLKRKSDKPKIGKGNKNFPSEKCKRKYFNNNGKKGPNQTKLES